jgi:hypothetical protein
LGKPVKIGEQVMLLAGVNNKQLDINVAVDDMIPMKESDNVRFFPNVDPLRSLDAKIDYASYIAAPGRDQTLTYFVAAQFNPNQKILRYGLRGTAKVYGSRVTLFFYLFRRPIAFLQSFLGV